MKLRNRVIGLEKDEEQTNSTSSKTVNVPSPDMPSTSRRSTIDRRRYRNSRVRHPPAVALASSHKTHKCVFKTPRITRSIHDLPDHFMVKIFNELAIVDRIKVERVCRRFRTLSRGFSWTLTENFSYASLLQQTTCTVWRCIEDRPRVGNSQVRAIVQRCASFLRNMDLSAFRDSLTYAVCTSVSSCSRLHTLTLTGIQLTNSSLSLLGRHCPLIRVANLQRCFQESVVERGLSTFLSKCDRLRVLDVSENERLSGIPSFSHLPLHLESLTISGCFRLGGQAIESIRRRVTTLSTLVMDGVDMVTPEELNAFFHPLASLQTLKFGECFMSSMPGGVELTSLGRLRNLKELFLNDNLLITNAALSAIGRGCVNLEKVDISGCNRSVSDEGVAELAYLPRLVQLNLSLLRSITDQAVIAIARNRRLTNLLLHRCDHVTDGAIIEVAQHCKDLTKLDVSYCPRVTERGIWALYRLVDDRKEVRRTTCDDDAGCLRVWIARSGVIQPLGISHPKLQINETDNVSENTLEPVLFDIW